MKTASYAAQSATSPLAPHTIVRRDLRADDVGIEILYCGVCHSDLHMARNDWSRAVYPVVPGHEIVGRVTAAGPQVSKFKVGDHVAVGCFVDSCQHCDQCHQGNEHMCREVLTETYNGQDRITGQTTYGGYSKHIVVKDDFVLRMPEGLDLSRAAPLLCAGITTYSPLRTWNVGPGSRVGVVGLGGLGHMAVKLAVGLGAHVTVLSRSRSKEADALALGADRLLDTSDAEALAAAANSFDVIIDTVPVKHDINPYIPLLDIDATLVRRPARRYGRDVHRPGHHGPPSDRRIDDRRHCRNPGNAGFLRAHEHPAGLRNDPHGADQPGLRAYGAFRRALPFRHRHGLTVRAGWLICPQLYVWTAIPPKRSYNAASVFLLYLSIGQESAMNEGMLFFVIPFAIAAALPGPAQGALVARIVSGGSSSGLPFVLGMVTGNLAWLAAAMFGLSAVALRYELLFVVIKWLGIGYLLFMAWKLWHAPVTTATTTRVDTSGMVPGMLLTLGNPKAVIFFGAVLPHAFDMTSLSSAQMGLILALGFLIDLGIQLVYLFAASRARRFVQSEHHMRWVNRSSAGLMTGAAGVIAARS